MRGFPVKRYTADRAALRKAEELLEQGEALKNLSSRLEGNDKLDELLQQVLSNSDTAFVRSLYKGLRIDRVRCARAINCNAERRGEVDEVIVLGGFATRAARRTVAAAAR